MEELPGNSHHTKPNQTAEEKPKKIEKIVQGKVIQRKKPLYKRIVEAFFAGRADVAGEYVLLDVLVPAARDAIADMGTSFVDRMVYGETRGSRPRPSQRGGSATGPTVSYGGYTNYSSYSQSVISSQGARSLPSKAARSRHNFDELILATRVEAEELIAGLRRAIDDYKAVTVADLYEMLGVTADYVDDKWGWTDLRDAGVSRVRNGYLLDLPRPEHLD